MIISTVCGWVSTKTIRTTTANATMVSNGLRDEAKPTAISPSAPAISGSPRPPNTRAVMMPFISGEAPSPQRVVRYRTVQPLGAQSSQAARLPASETATGAASNDVPPSLADRGAARSDGAVRVAASTDSNDLGGAEKALASLVRGLRNWIDVTVVGTDPAIVQEGAAGRDRAETRIVRPVRSNGTFVAASLTYA